MVSEKCVKSSQAVGPAKSKEFGWRAAVRLLDHIAWGGRNLLHQAFVA